MAIMAALSPHNLIAGNIGLKFSASHRFIKTSLIFLFAATPPAITKVLSFFPLILLNSSIATLLFLYNISSTVF